MTPVDPLTLDPEGVSLHQVTTFVLGSALLADAVEQSPLFALQREGHVARAEWIATGPEEPVPYPLGRVTLHGTGILLEGFGADRLEEMKRHLHQLGLMRISGDETRVFRLEELLRDPSRALHPVEESRGVQPTAIDLARWYVRAGWTFQPCPDLDGRAPYTAAQTGRGRKRLAELIEHLPAKLRERYRDFPALDPKELHELLLPAPEPLPEADPPRVPRARRRA